MNENIRHPIEPHSYNCTQKGCIYFAKWYHPQLHIKVCDHHSKILMGVLK